MTIGAIAFWKWGNSEAKRKDAEKRANNMRKVSQKWADARNESTSNRLRRLADDARDS